MNRLALDLDLTMSLEENLQAMIDICRHFRYSAVEFEYNGIHWFVTARTDIDHAYALFNMYNYRECRDNLYVPL